MAKTKYNKEKQYGMSFFERVTICKIRRTDGLTCRNCVYIDSCKLNEKDIVDKLNSTLHGYKPRHPEKGEYT